MFPACYDIRLMGQAGSGGSRDDLARRYHRPRYAAFLGELALAGAVLALCAFSPAGDALYALAGWAPWWLAAPLFTALVLLVSALVRAPLAFWRGYVHERRFGFSTQTAGAFAADQAKSFAVTALLAAAGVLGLVALARAFPSAWPLAAAPLAALLVLVLTFVAPVLLEPLFNRFEPLRDDTVVGRVRALAARAGLPVRDVLVADASRRTRKLNAYVSGLGSTRRVVVYDTLLEKAGPDEIDVVVAHELGHRRHRHVALGTALGMAGAAAAVVVLWAVVGRDVADPRSAALMLLLGGALGLAAAPFQSAIWRRWEYACDRYALELTQDAGAFEAAFRRLSDENLPDPSPPKLLYLFLFTHPTVPERVAAARRWARARSGTVPA